MKEEEARVLASGLETAKAAVTLAQQDYDRIAALVKQGAVAEAVLDRSVDDRQKALDAVSGVEARLRVNAGEVASTLAEVGGREGATRARPIQSGADAPRRVRSGLRDQSLAAAGRLREGRRSDRWHRR